MHAVRARGSTPSTELVYGGSAARPRERHLRFRHELARRAVESEVAPHRRIGGCRPPRPARCAHGGGAATTSRGWPTTPREPARPTSSGGTRRRRHARPARLGAHREAAVAVRAGAPLPTRRAGPRSPSSTTVTPTRWHYVDPWPQAAEVRERAVSRSGTTSATSAGEGIATIASCALGLLAAVPRARSRSWPSRSGHRAPRGARPRPRALPRAHCHRGLQPLARRTPAAGRTMLRRRQRDGRATSATPWCAATSLNNVALGELRPASRLDPPDEGGAPRSCARGRRRGPGGPCLRERLHVLHPTSSGSPEGERFWRDGIVYCDEHDITTYCTCLRGHRAVALLDLGRWDEAVGIAERVLSHRGQPGQPADLADHSRPDPGSTGPPRPLRGARRGRRGGRRASTRPSGSSITRLARAEARWLAGDDQDAASPTCGSPSDPGSRRWSTTQDARLSVWEHAPPRRQSLPASPAPEPVGDLAGSATTPRGRRLGPPGVLLRRRPWRSPDSADDAHLRDAVDPLRQALGARAAARRTRQRMKDLGHRAAAAARGPAPVSIRSA